MRRHVELIAAVGPRGELGLKGDLPWPMIKGDMALFRRVTMGKIVVMGSRTWESLPAAHRPLKGRLNAVMTRSLTRLRELNLPDEVIALGALSLLRLRQAWVEAGHDVPPKIVIIGGAQIYREALEQDIVDVIHLSTIHHPEGWAHDVTFPPLHARGWVVVETVEHEPEYGAPHGWRYERLVRDPAHPAMGA